MDITCRVIASQEKVKDRELNAMMTRKLWENCNLFKLKHLGESFSFVL